MTSTNLDGWIVVVLALLFGATCYSIVETLFRVYAYLSDAAVLSLILFAAWALVSGIFVLLLGLSLFRVGEHGGVHPEWMVVAMLLAIPIVGYRQDSFTVLPYMLNFTLEVGGGLRFGVNTVAIVLLLGLVGLQRRSTTHEPGAIESQIGGS